MNAKDGTKNYIVVARRYRPQAFDELIGQAHVAHALTNAIKTNRVGHAYLFTGARGVGKTSAARILAKALNCQQGPTAVPCGKCSICQDIVHGEDVDVLEIDGASNRGIDEIRQLRSNVNIRPSRAKYKVYIIDEVHMLTMQAFNALLKTLEEPPEHVKFIFCTTDPEKIPITVLSRCQRFDFASVDSDSIRKRLEQICEAEKVTADPAALSILARRAAGSMRDSQSLLEQLLSFCGGNLTALDVQQLLGTADTGRVIELAQALANRQADVALQAVDGAINAGVDGGQLAEQLLVCFRDVAALKVGCSDALLQFAEPDDVAALREIGNQLGLETTLAILQILDATLTKMRLSTHMRTLLEIALVRAANLEAVESLGELLGAMQTGNLAVQPKPTAPSSSAAQTRTVPSQATTSPTKAASSASEEVPSASPKKKTDLIGEKLAVSEPSPPQPVVIDAQNVERVWSQVLTEIEDISAEFARSYKSLAISAPNQLVVTLASAYNKEECERSNRKTRFEGVLSRIAGQKMQIEFRVDKESAVPKPAAATKSKRQLMREMEKHPLIAEAIKTFDGEVVDLQQPFDRTKPPR